MVEMENDWDVTTKFVSILYDASSHISEKIDVCIISGASGYLKNNRALCFDTSLNDCLHLFHIVEVECTDGVSTLDCLGKHVSCVYQSKFFVACHIISLLNVKPLLIYRFNAHRSMLERL